MTVRAQSLHHQAGDVIAGKYQLTESIGQGGMGEVWEGVNLALDAPVAIKLMKADLSDDVLKQRLFREARTAAGLNHPAIIRVFDVGEMDGRPYVVMERLHGRSLRRLIDDVPQRDVVEVVQALLPILDALALAHERGLVHRDVKPDNIFLADIGSDRVQPKLLDFGVVKASTHHRFLTHTGTVVGSPPYMSPEHARGDEDLDCLADLWGIAVILYETATGRMPFEAPNYNALLRRIVEDDVPPVTAPNDRVLATLAPIIDRGLAKDRDARWQSAEELGRALAKWLMALGVSEDLTGQRLSGRWVAAGRKSIAERRRASLVDLRAADPLLEAQVGTPAARESVLGRQRRISSNAPTQVHAAASPAPPKRWLLLSGAGAGVVVLGLLALFATRGGVEPPNAASAVSAPGVPAAALGEHPVAARPRKAESSNERAPEAIAAPTAVASAQSAKPAARKKPLSGNREAAGAPRPAAGQRPVPAKKSSPPDLGLKDPY